MKKVARAQPSKDRSVVEVNVVVDNMGGTQLQVLITGRPPGSPLIRATDLRVKVYTENGAEAKHRSLTPARTLVEVIKSGSVMAIASYSVDASVEAITRVDVRYVNHAHTFKLTDNNDLVPGTSPPLK